MAHLNQREVREQRKNRKRAFLCIFLFLPLVLAGYFLITITNKTLNADTVEKILLSSGDYSVQLTAREDIALCMNAVMRAKKITEGARPLSSYTEVTLVCSDDYTKKTWRLYLSDTANDALMLNEEDKLYMLTAEDARALMLSDVFEFLYRTAPPAMTLSFNGEERTVMPSYNWHYLVEDKSERTNTLDAEIPKFDASAAPSFTLPDDPDETTLTVTVNGEMRRGTPADLATLLPESAAEVQVCITASWANPEADRCYGTAQYRFVLNYTPAEA